MNTRGSPLVPFYRGEQSDSRGRFLNDIQQQSLEGLETVHDYIQWMFPLKQPSLAHPGAPTLSICDIACFRADAALKRALLKSFAVMLNFYGLQITEGDEAIRVSSTHAFSIRRKVWLQPHNHNFLRITRILGSLTLLGCEPQALALFEWLRNVYNQESTIIGSETLQYWSAAIQTTP
jgi:hypothetical protein